MFKEDDTPFHKALRILETVKKLSPSDELEELKTLFTFEPERYNEIDFGRSYLVEMTKDTIRLAGQNATRLEALVQLQCDTKRRFQPFHSGASGDFILIEANTDEEAECIEQFGFRPVKELPDEVIMELVMLNGIRP